MALENTNDGDLVTINGDQYVVIGIHEGWHDQTARQEIQMTVREATNADVYNAELRKAYDGVDPLAGT
jgi:hypothetical protein